MTYFVSSNSEAQSEGELLSQPVGISFIEVKSFPLTDEWNSQRIIWCVTLQIVKVILP